MALLTLSAKSRRCLWLFGCWLLSVWNAGHALDAPQAGQTPSVSLPPGVAPRDLEQRPARLLPLVPERPGDDRQKLPPVPERPRKPAPRLEEAGPLSGPDNQALSGQIRVPVKTIKLTGNTVFSAEDLAKVAAPYVGRVLTSDDLLDLQQALTRFYIEKGYVNSGAVIPDQKVENGVIALRLVEGRLTGVELTGNDWLRDSYIQSRLATSDAPVLNIKELQERMLILQQDRLIDQLNGELRPGAKRGEAVLRLDVKEHRPFELSVAFNNRRSPSVGSLRGEVYATALNLTGFGDSLALHYGHNEGLNDGGAAYALPLNALDTRLRVYYDRSESSVVEQPFTPLGIASKVESYGIALSHPFYRTPTQQLTGELRFEKRHSQTFIFGDRPQAFSDGVRPDGTTDITALRLGQEWIDRDQNQVLAIRSTFNIGLDAWNANINPKGLPDGRFFSWLGQIQWLRRLGDTDMQLLLRSDLQLTADRLLPLEKFAVGGSSSVRGYRENILVRDNGWAGSVELRIPVFNLPLPGISERAEDGKVQLAPFFDVGWSEDNGTNPGTPSTLSSVGIGVRWDPHRQIHGELYWGHALRKLRQSGTPDLQDDGIHFNLALQLL